MVRVMTGNIRPFRPKTSAPTTKARVGALALYLGAGWLLFQQSLVSGQQGFSVFLLLGLIYWVFVRRHVVATSYFFRYHYLQATLAFLLVFGLCMLSVIVCQTVGSLLSLFNMPGLMPVTTLLLGTIPQYLDLAFKGLIAVIALSQGLAALAGKLPRLPVVSENAEFWA